jgi:hypothetical protein
MWAGFEGVLGRAVGHGATVYSIIELAAFPATVEPSQRRGGFLQCVRLPATCLAHSTSDFKAN